MYGEKDIKKTKKAYSLLEDASYHDYDYLGNSASAQDCTGLIPSGPVSEEELLSYKDVYDFPPPVMRVDAKPRTPDHVICSKKTDEKHKTSQT